MLDEADQETYYVAYLRQNFIDAPNSYVTLPQRFSIETPLFNEIHSRANPITITWQPANSGLTVNVSAFVDCTSNFGGYTDQTVFQVPSDTGSYTIPAGELANTNISGDCVTTLQVSKTQLGVIDPLLFGGRITAERYRSVSITTTD